MKDYDLKKIKEQGYTELKSLNDLKKLFVALNAEIETENGFTSYTIDSKNFNKNIKKYEIKRIN
jgi:hypothetical protein